MFCYNFSGGGQTFVRPDIELTADTREVCLEFDYDGGGIGLGGTARLSVDGAVVGSARIDLPGEGRPETADERQRAALATH